MYGEKKEEERHCPTADDRRRKTGAGRALLRTGGTQRRPDAGALSERE